jgi:hypothetical protein
MAGLFALMRAPHAIARNQFDAVIGSTRRGA